LQRKRQLLGTQQGRDAEPFQHRGQNLSRSRQTAVRRGIGWEQWLCPAIVGLRLLWCLRQRPERIAVRIQPGLLGRLDQAVDYRAALGAQWGVGKQEVLPSNHKGFDAAFGPVVAQLQPPILQIADQVRSLLLEIV